MKKIFFFLIFLFLISTVTALKIECFADGSVKIDPIGDKKLPVTARELTSKEYFDVPGRYSYNEADDEYDFNSDEALFISQKGARYSLKFGKSSYTITCPPFTFSCRIFNMTIDYCYTRDGIFTAKFKVGHYFFDEENVLSFKQPYSLRYEVKTETGKKYVHRPESYSPAFKDINITMRPLFSGNKFILTWLTDQEIEKFTILYDQCRQKRYNFYIAQECTDAVVCNIGRDCLADERCVEGTCQKLECTECQYIENNQCKDYQCCGNDACADNQECLDNSCVTLNCSSVEKAINHQCTELECAEDEFSINHQCEKLDCADDEEIINHECKKLTCGKLTRPFEHKCRFILSYWLKMWQSKQNSSEEITTLNQ